MQNVALSVVVTIGKSDVAMTVRSGEVVVAAAEAKTDAVEMEEVEAGELDHREQEEPRQHETSARAGMIGGLLVAKKKEEAGVPVELLLHEKSAHERSVLLLRVKLKKLLPRSMVGRPLLASVNEIFILRINPERNQVKIM